MKKNILIVVGVILLVVLAGAGGFWGGKAYQDNQGSQAQARFFEQRGGQADGQVPGGGQFPEGMQLPEGSQFQGGFRGMGGTMGEVKSIEGNVLTLSTAENVTTVNLSEDTKIVKSVEGTTGDLQSGVRVTVMGETDKDGNINASQITIVNEDLTTIRTAP
jgi:hypothetical protein